MDGTSVVVVGVVPNVVALIEIAAGFPERLALRIDALGLPLLAHRGRLAVRSTGPRSIRVGPHHFSVDVEKVPLRDLLWLLSLEANPSESIAFRASSVTELDAMPPGVPITQLALEIAMLLDVFVRAPS